MPPNIKLKLTEKQMYQYLADYVKKYSTYTEAAITLHISKQYLSDLLNGKRKLSDTIVFKLGFKRQQYFIKVRYGTHT